MNFNSPSAPARKGRAAKPKKARKITVEYLQNSGLYYLQRYAASRSHFESVMMRKVAKSIRDWPDQDRQLCEDMVRTLAVRFEESGLLNDESYSRAMVESLRRQGRSRRAITQKLIHKGVAEDLVTQKLQEHDGDAQAGEMLAALRFARKKKSGPFAAAPSDAMPSDAGKTVARFARAGFSYEITRKVLEMEEAEARALLS